MKDLAKMYYIHYPSGGFGHFMVQMASICFEDVFCPQEYSTFGKDGNSHSYPLHYRTWSHLDPVYVEKKYYDIGKPGDKIGICLIDSGIHDDKDKGFPNTIKMCIDDWARSIVFQTCKEKAELSNFDFVGEDYEIREQFSLAYHNADPNFCINKWQPTDFTININISDLFFNPTRIIAQLTPHFGYCNHGKFWTLWNEFCEANKKYYQAQHLVNRVSFALQSNFDFEFTKEYTLHDQGYLIYWLERQYNIKEIPPYDYRHWFKNTQEIRDCLNSILSQ